MNNGGRGLKILRTRCGSSFGSFFALFEPFPHRFKNLSGTVSFCRRAALTQSRSTTLREARRNLPLREGFLEASAGVSSRVLWDSAGVREISEGGGPMLVLRIRPPCSGVKNPKILQGSKTAKSGKEGFRVNKPHFPSHQKKRCVSIQNIPISLQGTTWKMGFSDSKRPFLG